VVAGVAGEAWLSKSEVNSRYYNAVAGDIAFITEGQHGHHPTALAHAIAGRAATLGKRQIRVLELGANNCSFARALLLELREMADSAKTTLARIDYLAVEYARDTLEAAADQEELYGAYDQVRRSPRPEQAGDGPSAKPTIVAYASVADTLSVNLGLVHAEANQFVRENTQSFDFAILNELLDDMPYRAFYADDAGRRREVVPAARPDGGRWTVRVSAGPVADGELGDRPAGMITARSEQCLELVTGIAGLLVPGGMLFLHDYGFPGRCVSAAIYDREIHVPPFVTMELPDGPFPRAFFRVFGNEQKHVVQVTNDVNFGELTSALEPTGTVFTIAHGSTIINRGLALERGQGTFLSELVSLQPGDDLDALLADLHARQVELRDDFVREYQPAGGSIFFDLVYIKR
jgi:hypothetical protein